MAKVTLTPDKDNASASWPVAGSFANRWEALADSSDTTYVENTGGSASLALGFTNFTLPALSQVRHIDWLARLRFPDYSTGDTDKATFYEANENAGAYVVERVLDDIRVDSDVGNSSAANLSIWTTTSPEPDYEMVRYDQTLVNNRAITVVRNTGTERLQILRVWLEVTYNEAPIVTVAAPASVATSRPTITWSHTDPENDAQDRAVVKVFSAAQYGAGGFAPETSTPTWSTEILGGTQSAVVGVDLQNGTTYRAYVKVADVGSSGRYGYWSGAGSGAYNEFTIALTPPPTPTLTATAEPSSSRVLLSATHGTYAPAAQRFVIQRTADDGTTWTTVRNADEAPPTSGSTLTVYDYEAPRGVPVGYRVQTVADPAGGRVASAWSATQTVTVDIVGWWLKDPAAPTLNTRITVPPGFAFRRKEPQTIYDPLGRDDSVVVGDGVKGIEGTLPLWAKTAAAYTAVEALLSAGRVLYLEDILGRAWYVKAGDGHQYELIRAQPDTGETTAIRHFHQIAVPFTEVRRPI